MPSSKWLLLHSKPNKEDFLWSEINARQLECFYPPPKREVYAHEKFVEPMLDYIVEDFVNSRNRFNDHTIGGMVVCDSADQARTMLRIFINKYNPEQQVIESVSDYAAIKAAAAVYTDYTERHGKKIRESLVLYDVGTTDDRKQEVEDFKDGKIDLLFVYNMLLTGFDAKRLKKLYIGRIVKDHNLLQTLTRVNRPYKRFPVRLCGGLRRHSQGIRRHQQGVFRRIAGGTGRRNAAVFQPVQVEGRD